jgi:hypothetical protein
VFRIRRPWLRATGSNKSDGPHVPLAGVANHEIGLVLVISLFVGLEREERKQQESQYAFGGVRTLPLIGLVSYASALVSGPELARAERGQ